MALKEKLDAIRKASSKRIPPDRIGWNLALSARGSRRRARGPREDAPAEHRLC
jgi:hypothetical protein